MKNNKLLLIDALSILSRAFYAIPMLTNKDGIATNGILGFLNMYLKIYDEESPQYVAVAFDMPKPTFRHKQFSEYKGTRKAMPKELVEQIPLLKELLLAMGISTIGIEGLEADDILGTLAKKAESKGYFTTIVSGDRDLLQCATDKIKISIPKTKAGQTTTEQYYAKDIMELMGVSPKEYIDVKALMGDSSDNIPGVPSIGEKTAIKIIQEYGNIENAIQNAQNIKPKKAGQNLIDFEEQAKLSKELATIIINADIKEEIESFTIENIYNPVAIEFYKRLSLKSMLKRSGTESGVKANTKTEFNSAKRLSNSEVSDFLDTIKGKTVAYYLYNNDVYIANDSIGVCLPISDAKPFFEDADIQKIAFDAKKDMHVLNTFEIKLLGLSFDILVGGYLLGELNDNSKLADASFIYLDEDIKEAQEQITILDTNIENENHPNAELLYKIYPIILQKLESNGLDKLYYGIEHPLIHVLYDMENIGITVDKSFIIEFGKKLLKFIDSVSRDIFDIAGCEFNLNSPKQIGDILFDKMGIKGGKKTKTGFSTTAEVLKKLAKEHPIASKILEYRQYAKLNSTYVDGLLKTIAQDNRIHTTFSQVTAATGRLSSIDPNLQNIPIRTALGRELRRAFVAKPGYTFVDADYSQIELRVLAHLSNDITFITAFKDNKDIHRITAGLVFNLDFEDVTEQMRSYAKAVNFGIVYGISAFSLSDDIKVSVKEAEVFISNYFAQYPGVKSYLDNAIEDAKQKGYAETLLKRKRAIPELKNSNYITRSFGERVAMNMPVQGSAADIIKLAMINVCKALKHQGLSSRLILQIHDELLIEAKLDEVEQVKEILKKEMSQAALLSVPLLVDISAGDSWYDTK